MRPCGSLSRYRPNTSGTISAPYRSSAICLIVSVRFRSYTIISPSKKYVRLKSISPQVGKEKWQSIKEIKKWKTEGLNEGEEFIFEIAGKGNKEKVKVTKKSIK